MTVVGGVITGGVGVAVVNALANRRKVRAEAHLTETQADKTATEAVLAATARLLEMQSAIFALQTDTAALKLQVAQAEERALHSEQQREMLAEALVQDRDKIARLETRLSDLEREREALLARIAALEAENATLKAALRGQCEGAAWDSVGAAVGAEPL